MCECGFFSSIYLHGISKSSLFFFRENINRSVGQREGHVGMKGTEVTSPGIMKL